VLGLELLQPLLRGFPEPVEARTRRQGQRHATPSL
jgi:hypothetical protein